MKHNISQLLDDQYVGIGAVLSAVLNQCERDIKTCFSPNYSSLKTRKNLMHKLFVVRIRIARLLTALLWTKNSENHQNIEKLSNVFDENCRKSIQQLRSIKTHQSLSCLSCIFQFQAKFDNISFKNASVDPRSKLICLLQNNIPPEISNISLRKNVVLCFSRSKYKYAFKILGSGYLSLISFTLYFDFPASTTKKITSLLSSTLSNSKNPFFDMNLLMKRLETIGKFVSVCSRIKQAEKLFGFTIHQKENYAIIRFGKSPDHCIEYWVTPRDMNVCIFSMRMLEQRDGSEKKFFKRNVSSEDVDLQEILSEMRDAAVYARLHSLHQRLVHAFVVAGFPTFSCNIEGNNIVIRLLDFLFCRVFLSRWDCEPEAILYNDLGITAKEFVHALSCDECERVSISHSLYLVSVARSLLCTVCDGMVDSLGATGPVKSCVQRSLRFSFAPSFYIRMTDLTGKMMLDIISEEDKSITSTHEMIVLNTLSFRNDTRAYYLGEAIKSAKAACLVLQMQKFLVSIGIDAQAENNKVHFSVPNFECVEFKCDYNAVWSLLFVKPINSSDGVTVCIHGNKISANFCAWLWNLVQNVGKMMVMAKDLRSTCDIMKVVKVFSEVNKLSFTYRTALIIDPWSHVFLSNVRFDARIGNVEHFTVMSFDSPKIKHEFSFYTPFKTLAQHYGSIKNEKIPFNNIVILLCSYTNMLYWMFKNSTNWTVMYDDDNKYRLVYMGKYTFEIRILQYTSHRLYAAKDASNELMIPLSSLGLVKDMHSQLVIMQFYVPKMLSKFKLSVENYFNDKKAIESLGFNAVKISPTQTDFEMKTFGNTYCTPVISALGMEMKIVGDYAEKISKFINSTDSRIVKRYITILAIGGFDISPVVGNSIIDNIFMVLKLLAVDVKSSLPTAEYNSIEKVVKMKLNTAEHKISIRVKSNRGKCVVEAYENSRINSSVYDFATLIEYYTPKKQ